jgi:hypothetical protein
MNVIRPSNEQVFQISSAAEWPSIEFMTDGSGPHVWSWSIEWGSFKKSGEATTQGNTWDAREICAGMGGKLTVRIGAGDDSGHVAIKIVGTNPGPDEVNAYLRSHPKSDGFERIIAHESKYRHFTSAGEPARAFDKGYGMCQLTYPPPSFEQVWDWKKNVDGGLALFGQKRALAQHYLGQNGRHFTPDQLLFETVCQWNGGSYHVWDEQAGAWARTPNILCDSSTGNIGWDLNLADNQGKSEAELHQRDSHSYSAPPGHNSKWKYSGVCYADKLLK